MTTSVLKCNASKSISAGNKIMMENSFIYISMCIKLQYSKAIVKQVPLSSVREIGRMVFIANFQRPKNPFSNIQY